ncbi:MAG: DUF2934 domain-containing protein [Betaproteobacteria bacterium]|jgi:hypothetical protein|nr:DUF2934 domain-containing protein [Betaproteobacteria bacterium]
MTPRSTSIPGKPAVKTTTGKPSAGKSPTAAARPRRKAAQAGPVKPEERMRLIAEAAYYKAEKRYFTGGGELDDWIEAEAEIDTLLDSRKAR